MPHGTHASAGVGGWLALFIVTLCIAAAASLVSALGMADIPGAARFGSAWTGYLALVWALSAAKAAGCGYMAWRLHARRFSSTPRLVIAGLWTLAVVPGIVDGVAGIALLGLAAGEAGRSMAAELLRPTVYAAIWTAYLLRSRRVAATYADPGEEPDTPAAVLRQRPSGTPRAG